MNKWSCTGSQGSTNFQGATGFYSGATSYHSGTTWITGTTGLHSMGVHFTIEKFSSEFLQEINWEGSGTDCCNCWEFRKHTQGIIQKYIILKENPIYIPNNNLLFKIIRGKKDIKYICNDCANILEKRFIKNTLLEDLPLWISFKWVHEKNFEFLKSRLYNGK